MFDVAVSCLVLTALLAYVNHRFIGLPITIGVMGIALLLSFALFGLDKLGFGALRGYEISLISSIDPIAVMGILKSAGAPKSLEIVIAGESRFNDGVGVVLLSLMLAMATGGEAPTAARGTMLLLEEGGGGIAFGLVLGYGTYRMLKSIDSYQEEVLITLAAVLGGYALASRLHVSSPLAMVVAGLIIGNHGRALAMSDKTREHLDMFWELLDSILNAVLFMLIGLEVILIEFSTNLALAAVSVIATTLVARLLSVGAPIVVLGRLVKSPRGAWKVLTCGGLRGGISVALALSLPIGPQRNLVLALDFTRSWCSRSSFRGSPFARWCAPNVGDTGLLGIDGFPPALRPDESIAATPKS